MSEATSQTAHEPLHISTPPPIDLSTIPSQLGHAILSPDGTILNREGQLSENDVAVIYRMMLEVGTVTNGEGIRRVTVGFGGVSYVVGIGTNGCLYVVKKKSS
jgi:hypothetical protein